MKLFILSDLHAEFETFEVPKELNYDVAVLAGDIMAPGRAAASWLRDPARFGDKPIMLIAGSFQHEGRERGRIVISPAANWDTRRRLGFDDPMLRIREWHEGLAHYLERHLTWWQLC